MASTIVTAVLAFALGSPRVVGEDLDQAKVAEVQHAIDRLLSEREEELAGDAIVSVRPGPDGNGFLYRVEIDGEALGRTLLCGDCTSAELGSEVLAALAEDDQLQPIAPVEPTAAVPPARPPAAPEQAPIPEPTQTNQRRVDRLVWSGAGVLVFGGLAGGLGGAALEYSDSSTPVRRLGIAGLAIGGACAIAGLTLMGLGIAEASGRRSRKRAASRLRLQSAGLSVSF